MADELTDDQKKAKRAEINRENAKKSTGPKSQVGKMSVRLNGLKLIFYTCRRKAALTD